MKTKLAYFRTSLTPNDALIKKIAKLSSPLLDNSLDPEKAAETTATVRQLYLEIFKRSHAACVLALQQRQFSRIEKDKRDPNTELNAVIPMLKKLSEQQPLSEEEKATVQTIRLNTATQIRNFIRFEEKLSQLHEKTSASPRP